MITRDDMLKGRDKIYPQEFTQQISDNVDQTVVLINLVQASCPIDFIVESGWRSLEINQNTKNSSPISKHISGLACDIIDSDGQLMQWCLLNLDILQRYSIFMENFDYTPTWVHMQIVQPNSGHRIFIPDRRVITEHRWNGIYSAKYNVPAAPQV